MQANKAEMETTDETKVCATRAILQVKIKMAQEVVDLDFDRSAWDVGSWKQTLLQLGGEVEPESVKAAEAGSSVRPYNITAMC
ncbi:hypothetical protein Hanom_Chr13g01192161 [Helianthus anomalus]